MLTLVSVTTCHCSITSCCSLRPKETVQHHQLHQLHLPAVPTPVLTSAAGAVAGAVAAVADFPATYTPIIATELVPYYDGANMLSCNVSIGGTTGTPVLAFNGTPAPPPGR